MTPKQAELFLKCWEHNISWGQTLMQEYFLTNSGAKGYALKFLFSYGCKQAKQIIRRCKKEYNYDVAAMIKDQKTGKATVGPLPIRFIYKFLRQNK
jgi:hypothetical protein